MICSVPDTYLILISLSLALSLTLSAPSLFSCISSGRECGISHHLMEMRRAETQADLLVIGLDLLRAE